MSFLYLDCTSGISGDMTVAALLDAGADEEKLLKALNSIRADGFTIKISRVTKSGLDCCDFDVILDHEHENNDHDMEYLYARSIESRVNHEHAHSHERGHSHEHSHGLDQEHPDGHEHSHDHDHAHRTLADITSIIDSTDATEGAKDLAKKIFKILAEAEAKAHATTIENVHFHEVGAIDSIVDIMAAAVCFDDLGISGVVVPRICDGHGTVRCQHGIIPVPVPAVMNIAQMYGLPLSVTDKEGEYVTPTGAAFVAAVMTDTKLPDVIIPKKIGMGAGKREYEQPGILRAVIY